MRRRFDRKKVEMQHVMFYYNGIQGEEELHEDAAVAMLVEGTIMERAGEFWKVVEIKTDATVSEARATDVMVVHLAGPVP